MPRTPTSRPVGDGRERDQTLADTDQTSSDSDQTAADTDQTAADTDQAASDTDQAASDRDFVHGGDPGVHEHTRDLREKSSQQRQQGAELRTGAAADRDQIAHDRDLAAQARDEAAEQRDRRAAARDADTSAYGRAAFGAEILARASTDRKRAEADRVAAAEGRARAASDREQAVHDREQASRDRAQARAERDALLAELSTMESDQRSDRARTQQALRESEERYRLLAENSSDVIVRISGDGTASYASPSTLTVFGYQPEEIIRHADWSAIHPEDLPVVRNVAAAFVAGSEEIAACEFRARRKDGSYVWVDSRTRRLSNPVTGAAEGFQSALREITARKEAEAETERAQRNAEQANLARSGFLRSMGHELRTPLNAVLGFTGTLLMGLHGPLAEDQITQLRTVERTGKHLLSLINSLLDLGRIEAERTDLCLEPIDCRDLLEEVAVELRPLAAEKGLELELRSDPVPVELLSDRRAVIRILISLLDNAITYTDTGSVRIDVDQHRAHDRLHTRFSVIDTGSGIALEQQEQLSAALSRNAPADASLLHGSGLGLYVANSLAELIGGEITYQSVPGTGSTFVLELAGSGA